MSWFVYFLRNKQKDWYYVGSTNDIERRFQEHEKGKVFSSKIHRPLELVFKKEFSNEKEARAYERKVKDKRIEKERIIRQIESRD